LVTEHFENLLHQIAKRSPASSKAQGSKANQQAVFNSRRALAVPPNGVLQHA